MGLDRGWLVLVTFREWARGMDGGGIHKKVPPTRFPALNSQPHPPHYSHDHSQTLLTSLPTTSLPFVHPHPSTSFPVRPVKKSNLLNTPTLHSCYSTHATSTSTSPYFTSPYPVTPLIYATSTNLDLILPYPYLLTIPPYYSPSTTPTLPLTYPHPPLPVLTTYLYPLTFPPHPNPYLINPSPTTSKNFLPHAFYAMFNPHPLTT